MKKLLLFLLFFGCIELMASIGKITALKGEVYIKNTSGSTAARIGNTLELQDEVITKDRSKALILFNDQTSITVGKNSNLLVKTYVFDNKQASNNEAQFQFGQGVFRTITGKIGKLNKEKFTIKTPTASIGIRGTNFDTSVTPATATVPSITNVGVTDGGISYTNTISGETFNVDKGQNIQINPVTGDAKVSQGELPATKEIKKDNEELKKEEKAVIKEDKKETKKEEKKEAKKEEKPVAKEEKKEDTTPVAKEEKQEDTTNQDGTTAENEQQPTQEEQVVRGEQPQEQNQEVVQNDTQEQPQQETPQTIEQEQPVLAEVEPQPEQPAVQIEQAPIDFEPEQPNIEQPEVNTDIVLPQNSLPETAIVETDQIADVVNTANEVVDDATQTAEEVIETITETKINNLPTFRDLDGLIIDEDSINPLVFEIFAEDIDGDELELSISLEDPSV
ncbi:MAG: FecR domain-containing protein, partial [Campylobacterales bacterium]|nr:FecR domain-containing protein [Campylobacterales bacterium]